MGGRRQTGVGNATPFCALVSFARGGLTGRFWMGRLAMMNFEEHGGRHAVLRTLVYGVAAFGLAQRYRKLDRKRIDRVVFACKGNICRSPFAQSVATRSGLAAASFGIDAETGSPADPAAIRAAAEFGIDLSAHRATHATDFPVTLRDLIVGFEPDHVERLVAIDERFATCQITLLPAWCVPPNLYIHDPFGAHSDYFRRCFTRIDRAVGRLSRDLALVR